MFNILICLGNINDYPPQYSNEYHPFYNGQYIESTPSFYHTNGNIDYTPQNFSVVNHSRNEKSNFHLNNQVFYQLNSNSEEESTDSSSKSKKRKLSSSKQTMSKKSILEDLLELLDAEIYGIRWCKKIDTEGDEQDGMIIYNEEKLGKTLKEKRNVKNYGLSKHLHKDLRYYGFIYDKESKLFWNEDNKDKTTKKSYWQREDRSKCLQLKRITGEVERNLSRILSLVKNIEFAEALKHIEICQKLCPYPNKYIHLDELSILIKGVTKIDVHNIVLILTHAPGLNDVVKSQYKKNRVLTREFDRLLSRMGGSHLEFLTNFREFIRGANKWYHGFIKNEDATNLLRNQVEGTFLIRESSNSDCFSLSYTANTPNGLKVCHMRITQTSAGFSVNTDQEPSRTLPLWIKKHCAYLKYPLQSEIFMKLIVQSEPIQTNDHGPDLDLPKDYVSGFPE